MYQKNVMKKNMLIYYWQEKKTKGTMFLSKILVLSCINVHYIVEENIFHVNIVVVTSFQYRRNFKTPC